MTKKEKEPSGTHLYELIEEIVLYSRKAEKIKKLEPWLHKVEWALTTAKFEEREYGLFTGGNKKACLILDEIQRLEKISKENIAILLKINHPDQFPDSIKEIIRKMGPTISDMKKGCWIEVSGDLVSMSAELKEFKKSRGGRKITWKDGRAFIKFQTRAKLSIVA